VDGIKYPMFSYFYSGNRKTILVTAIFALLLNVQFFPTPKTICTLAQDYEIFFGQEKDYYNIYVSEVINGSTIRLENGQILKFIGIDTPKNSRTSKLKTDAQKTGIHEEVLLLMGQEAAKFTRQLLEGKYIRVEFDKQKFNNYGMIEGYVYLLPEDIFVNAEIIKKGYAALLSNIEENSKYKSFFEKLHQKSLQQSKGVWKTWQEQSN